jgi:hypothetical protein
MFQTFLIDGLKKSATHYIVDFKASPNNGISFFWINQLSIHGLFFPELFSRESPRNPV